MPDLKISELPAATTLSDADITALVQPSPNTTRRVSMAQLRRQLLTDRGVDVRDFGAVGNGVANDAPAIQAAINALGSAGGVVNLGARTYRLASAIVVNNGAIRLVGQGFNEGGSPGAGTWLTVDQTNFTPFTFSATAARGSAVMNLAVRQTHSATQDASWAPTAYDWFFRVENCLGGVDFDNILLSGINRGIFIRNSGRADLRRIRGQVFTAGIEIDESFDTARLMNIHFWPFWSANTNVVRWQQVNGDAMIFRRVDGIFVDQSFVLGYRTMFRFSSSAAGFTQKFSIGQAYADFVRHGVLVEAAGTDGQIDSMTVQCELFNASGAPLPGSVGIMINANSSRIQVANLRVDDAEDNAIRLEQHSNRLDIGALRVVNFNLRANGASAIHLVNATTGVPNRVNLGSNPLLETAVMGPLFNAGSNGSVGVLGPAGEAARPGLSVGEAGTGLARPAAGVLSASAAGTEVLRATAGSVTLGAAPGTHGLEVSTPAGSLNRIQALGGVTGTPGRVGWQAAGADANIDAVVGQPRGAGALLAQFPDAAATGGAARGAGAVDLQLSRNAASQVASGQNSIIVGGDRNTASGTRAAILGGFNNAAVGVNSIVAGGANNSASGSGAWVPGGDSASTRNQQMGAWAFGAFASAGDAQAGERVLRRQTTDATPLRLSSSGADPAGATNLNIPSNSGIAARLLVVAQQTGGSAGTVGDSACWEVTVMLRRLVGVATTTYLGGTVMTSGPALAAATAGSALAPSLASAGATAWRLTLDADTVLGGLAVTATGEANKTIRWVARILSTEVAA
ncbi:glycosyl hydrolase family 28-related protein [Roseococcus thiosulfatophilus]|uniref:glycosyl hydrolase family 28-related protein n=1 Tax=Roseococcus thiosulfatophilus TaxID=35813 RepID=UPI001A8F5D05|nr:glycosyl hydrolase family 28-related protein [Roseococcus thiosulfatophilus]